MESALHFPPIEAGDIAVDPADIEALLGQGGEAQDPVSGEDDRSMALRQHTRNEIERITALAGEHLDIRTAYTAVDIGASPLRPGKQILRYLEGATSYIVFLVTIGPGPEELSRAYFKEGAYLEGCIADLVASALVEGATEQLHGHIRGLAEKKGIKSGNRYSPGYCGWDVADQHHLFELFPPGCCGISLSASALMTPVKSVSGLIPLGPDMKFQAHACGLCDMTDCSFRKAKRHS